MKSMVANVCTGNCVDPSICRMQSQNCSRPAAMQLHQNANNTVHHYQYHGHTHTHTHPACIETKGLFKNNALRTPNRPQSSFREFMLVYKRERSEKIRQRMRQLRNKFNMFCSFCCSILIILASLGFELFMWASFFCCDANMDRCVYVSWFFWFEARSCCWLQI